jgi:hypothetical protein
MADQRKGDLEPYTKFRTGRFFKDGGQWYFLTREGTMEGPFELRLEAENRLEDYIKVMTSGFMPPESELSIEPLDLPHPN